MRVIIRKNKEFLPNTFSIIVPYNTLPEIACKMLNLLFKVKAKACTSQFSAGTGGFILLRTAAMN